MEPAAVQALQSSGIPFTRFPFRSASINPFSELRALISISIYLRKHKPDIVHCVSPKGVLYGGIASRVAGIRSVVFAISGMGYASTKGRKESFGRAFLGILYNSLLAFVFLRKNIKVIVQNTDDKHFFQSRYNLEDAQLRLIPGSGVDVSEYENVVYSDKENIVLFPARMLKDKGVIEFIQAATSLAEDMKDWRFILAGAADYENPSSVSANRLESFEYKNIEWIGHIENMVPLYKKASIVCLPSYREGMPKCLLEGAAAGCAIVTTDAIGCRDAVIPGVTGDIVPCGDSAALAQTLIALMIDKTRRAKYGYEGRTLAISKYNVTDVIKDTLLIYDELIAE